MKTRIRAEDTGEETDNPKFVPLEEADQWIGGNELVLAIIY